MRMMALAASATLLSLPSEVIETILVSSTSPRTVASVARTCRTLHTLVYTSPDSHLWRELFLATWDDPRPALEHYSFVDPRIDPTVWDWGFEYRKRVSAERWLKAWRRDVYFSENYAEEGTDVDCRTSALSAVLNTLLTLRPFPPSPPIALKVLTPAISPYPTGNIGSGVGDLRERLTSAPPLPPLLIMLASGFMSESFRESRSATRLERLVYGPHASRPVSVGSAVAESKSVPTSVLAPLPTPSLPPQLMRTLLPLHEIGVRGLQPHGSSLSNVDHWEDGPLGDIFHRIICITGFVPMPPPLIPTSTSTSHNDASLVSVPPKDLDDAEDEYRESDERDKHCQVKGFPTPSLQCAEARTLARRRVYEMGYLRGDRFWGPFRLVTRDFLDGTSGRDVDSEYTHEKHETRSRTSGAVSGDYRAHRLRLGTLAWAMGVDVEPDGFDSTSDEGEDGDEDWHDSADVNSEFSWSEHGGHQNQDANDAEGVETEPAESENPSISLILASTTADSEPVTNPVSLASSHRRTRRSNSRRPPNNTVSPHLIKPQHLRPDYAYLASVRIVVEANLNELFGNEISDNVQADTLQVRVGGVGMFWEDEDEILRARAEMYRIDSSSSRTASLVTSTPLSDTSSIINDSRTFELADILGHFKNLEVIRLGGACGYWGGWIERQQSAVKINGGTDASASSSPYDIGTRKPRIVAQREELEKPNKGKGKEKGNGRMILGDWEVGTEGEPCEGWDWAGVAGIWRRCVCWMDYRELLYLELHEILTRPVVAYQTVYNSNSAKFFTHETQEACRIIPMDIRITGYSRAGLMPVHGNDTTNVFPGKRSRTGYFRPPPVIHFSGSSVGSDRGLDDGRTVRGSVQLIGGGEVRWHMVTYSQESTMPETLTPEWSSEAIQVGGLGSAIGVLGMWTGARHEEGDPLGPFWAWKVA